LPATLATYSDWIRGDALKRGKSEHSLREVLGAIVTRLGSQVTWNALARELSINHPQTVAGYVQLLAAMDALFEQPALVEDRLAAAPKKARKVMPTDPFIYHAVRAWLEPVADPFAVQMQPCAADSVCASALVELCVVTHARRHFPCFYIKAEGEVDLAIVADGRFWPLEVKWRRQVRPKGLKQVAKYPQAAIAAPTRGLERLGGVAVIPVPVVLCRLAAGRLPAPQPDEG
jgi:predicted AAA+ superfamily ATPase